MGDLLQLAIYNPAILKDDDFLTGFVARRDIADDIVRRLREIKPKSLARHRLILGQRGMGKTSLLRRIAIAVRQDPELSQRIVPLTFREEQYNVHNLHTFWCNCLDALADHFERGGEHEKAIEIDAKTAALTRGRRRPTDGEGEEALAILKSWARKENKRILLLLDNVDLILDGLAEQDWSLRRTLQEAGGLVVIGAATAYLEATADPQGAFYDFFQVTVLGRLGPDELIACLRRLAAARGDAGRKVIEVIDTDPGRVRTLHDLTGGNLRTLVLLYLLLERDVDDEVMDDLERLLDEVTVLYKARVEDLAPQARVVLDAVALHWDPVTAAKVAEITGMETAAVSTQLDRLSRNGIVEKTAVSTSARTAFQLGERFFNIWYLMRHGPRRQRTRLRWLTAFLRSFYSPPQLKDKARAMLSGSDRQARSGHFCLALGDAVEDKDLRNLLGLEARRGLEQMAERKGKRLEDIVDLTDLPTPTSATEWFGIGWCLHTQLGRYEEAEAAYRRVIELDPENAYPWNNLGTLMMQYANRIQESEAAFRQAIKLDPDLLGPWVNLGNLLRDHLARYEDAEAAYRQAIKVDPKEATPWNNLGNLLHGRLARYQDAEAAYRQAIALDPKSGDSWNSLGVLLQDHLARYDDAEMAYRQAIELDPKHAYPWNNLGNLLKDQPASYEDAEAAYRQAIALNPKYASPWNGLGNLLMDHLGRYDEAEAAYRHATMLDPKLATPWNGLGNLLQDYLHRPDEATEAYHRCLALDPDNAYATANLAYQSLASNRTDANTYLNAALDKLPAHGGALLRAYAALARGDFAGATLALGEALTSAHPELHSDYFDDILRLLRLAAERKRGDELLAWLDESGHGDRHWPLRAAFDAYLHGEARLNDVNPEVGNAARRIYQSLADRSVVATLSNSASSPRSRTPRKRKTR